MPSEPSETPRTSQDSVPNLNRLKLIAALSDMPEVRRAVDELSQIKRTNKEVRTDVAGMAHQLDILRAASDLDDDETDPTSPQEGMMQVH